MRSKTIWKKKCVIISPTKELNAVIYPIIINLTTGLGSYETCNSLFFIK